MNAAEMSDRVIVETIKNATIDEQEKRELKKELYHRYERFVHKHWHALTKQLNSSIYLTSLKKDFYNDSYITFANALEAVRPEKIENDKWKFLGYYGFYLSNQRNSYAKKIIQKHRTEVSTEVPIENGDSINLLDLSSKGTVESAEDSYFEKDYKERFWKALYFCRTQLWDKVSKELFDMRAEEKPIRVVCDSLNISSWKYGKLLTQMKTQLLYYIDHPKEIPANIANDPIEPFLRSSPTTHKPLL